MADDLFALADLLVINDMSIADLEVTDILDDAPLLNLLAADIASNGTLHKYTKETGAPVVGFRAANDGRDLDSSIDTLVTVTLQILDASFLVDAALASAYQRGGAAGLVSREAKRHLRAAMFHAEKQIINGVINDSAGFVGLRAATTIDALADTMVVNAGGDTADTCSSVYLLRSTPEGNDVTVIAGQGGQIEIGETVSQLATGANSKPYPALWTPMHAYLGLQIGSAQSVGRICNLDFDHTLTDDMIYQAIAKFPAGRLPTHIAMNRNSLEKLRDSRTATNATGAPAPRPTDVEGIPIVVTDAILNTEAVVA